MRKVAIGCLCVLAILCGVALYQERPIIPSGAYVAVATNTNGTSYLTRVYRPILMPRRLFINVPDVPDARYTWFGVDLGFNVVGAANWPRRRFPGLPYVSRSPGSLGVGLLDGKIEDKWTVAFTPAGIAFSNAWLTVRVAATQ